MIAINIIIFSVMSWQAKTRPTNEFGNVINKSPKKRTNPRKLK